MGIYLNITVNKPVFRTRIQVINPCLGPETGQNCLYVKGVETDSVSDWFITGLGCSSQGSRVISSTSIHVTKPGTFQGFSTNI